MSKKTEEGDIIVKGEEDIAEMKEEIKKEVIAENTPTDAQQELFNKILEEAQMPVTMKDEDFTLGPNELDIRGLSKKNQSQMVFRSLVLQNVYLKQCLTSIIDTTRLLMVIANKMGVENIPEATDEVMDKLFEQNAELKKLKEQAAKKDA